MRLLRGLLGGLLWIVAGLLGLVGFLLCVTVILLPLGIPFLMVARRLFTRAVQLMLPPELAHPIREPKKQLENALDDATKTVGDATKKVRKFARKQRKRVA
jgi:hypothetical protein